MKKIKIAFFAEVLIKDYDGAARTIHQIIDRIDRDRYEFIFFCGMPPSDDFPYEVFHVPTLTIPFNKDYKMASMFKMGPRVVNRLDQYQPDLIHISTPSPLGYFGLKYALRKDIPTTTIYHTHFISYVKYYTKGAPFLTPMLKCALTVHNRSFYNRCSRVFVPTESIAQELSALDFDPSLFYIWPRGIALDRFSPELRDVSKLYNITRNQNINLLFASRLVWEKNLELLIDLQNIITYRKLPYNLLIVGDGVAYDELQLLMPDAYFLGHKTHEELAIIYASADYFVFPSITETYGNVIIEAMASGLPCIIADGGGTKSLVNQGINGYLCDANDAEDFIEKIQLLEQYPSHRKRMVDQARHDVESQSWDQLVSDLFQEINNIVTHHQSKMLS